MTMSLNVKSPIPSENVNIISQANSLPTYICMYAEDEFKTTKQRQILNKLIEK